MNELNSEKKLKLTPRMLSRISLIINKMGISSFILDINEETGNDELDRQMVVKKLLSLVIDNMYKVEDDIIELIAKMKNISIEEAEEIDIIPLIEELLNNDKIKSFLK